MAAKSKLRNADAVFNALGDTTRRAIVHDLCRRPATVSGLAASLQITKTAVGQHIGVLERCGLVRSEKIGRVRTCHFDASGLGVLQTWIDVQRSTWARGLDRLGDVLDDDA